VRKVAETGILPRLNTGIAHKEPGIGMVGAGVLRAPEKCFAVAFAAERKGFRYEPKEERVYVNKTQYFEPIPLELREYQIGGYQVLEKWLKDRRERRLTLEEIKTYCRVVTAIQRTIALQEEIDALYPKAEDQIMKMKKEQQP
jgi:hypothetical protein